MGGSQSQEDRSQTFSTIGLPPSSLYSHPERTQSLRVPRDVPPTTQSRSRDQLYRSNTSHSGDVEDSDGWLRVNPPPTRPPARITQLPLPPIPSQAPPPPPRQPPPPRISSHPRMTQEVRSSSSRRQGLPASHSARQFNDQEIMDLEQLLSTLHRLQLSSRPSRNGNSEDSGSGTDQSERRRRHAQGSVGSSRSRPRLRHHHSAGSPFLFLRPMPKVKCPLCSKEFTQPELDEHLPICSQKPRVQYNEDKLIQDAGECSICLDDMVAGDEIARLPCLCVYHIQCLKEWYTKSQTCPEHPDMKGV